ncbi:F-box protein [Cardamine amara subsp. amara]|uniref:F-box protein n=1 Tax=Cardamine amara subsp. amara TaxID=228776 RepID=A0ABD1ATE5_CARAN
MKRRDKERRKKRAGGEQVPHALIEEILERLGVESLIRFTCVSKQWNSTIKSTSFASRHLIRAQLRDPDVLLAGARAFNEPGPYTYLKKLEFGSSELKKFHIMPQPYRCCAITGSCDGLVCVYDFERLMYIINPATRWRRSLPRPKIQQIRRVRRNLDCGYYNTQFPGFGKDTMTGKYKIVWLYNSLKLDLDGHTTCEVFDFSTSTWRYVFSSTHPTAHASPVYLDGSLYWLTLQINGETKMIYFDLHTEVFKVMAEIPVVHASPCRTVMCILSNRLCVSEKKNNSQDIWSLNSHMVWEKTYSLNLSITSQWLNKSNFPIAPVTVFNKTELLLLCQFNPCLLVKDNRIGSYSLYSKASQLDQAFPYIPSLISI